MLADVDQSIRRSTRKPRLNHDENMWTKSRSIGRKIVAAGERVEELLAHPHQRSGAAGRKVEPPQQFLPARLGRDVDTRGGDVRRVCAPGLDRGGEPLVVGPEFRRESSRKRRPAARRSAPRSAPGSRSRAPRPRLRRARTGAARTGRPDWPNAARTAAVAVAGHERAAAICDRLQHVAEK